MVLRNISMIKLELLWDIEKDSEDPVFKGFKYRVIYHKVLLN